MGAHKHGIYSFTVRIERMRAVAGQEYVAEVTSLRKHDFTGAAKAIDVPNLPEQYGETASEAEGHAVSHMRLWLQMATPILIRDNRQRRTAARLTSAAQSARPARAAAATGVRTCGSGRRSLRDRGPR
jgi:hypothetical protein